MRAEFGQDKESQTEVCVITFLCMHALCKKNVPTAILALQQALFMLY